MKDPKLLQLDILEKPRFDKKEGSRRVKISPSTEKIDYGVAININDHFELKNNMSNFKLISLLENYLDESNKYSKKLVENMIGKINFTKWIQKQYI